MDAEDKRRPRPGLATCVEINRLLARMRNSSRALHYIGIQHALVVRASQGTALRAWVAYRPDPCIAWRPLIAPLTLWSLRPLWAFRTRLSRLGRRLVPGAAAKKSSQD